MKKHRCDERVRMHKCIDCEHLDLQNMKCHPDNDDCEKEYDLEINDLTKDDVCDFFLQGEPYLKTEFSYDTVKVNWNNTLTKCPYCNTAVNIGFGAPTLSLSGYDYYRCPYCEKLFMFGM